MRSASAKWSIASSTAALLLCGCSTPTACLTRDSAAVHLRDRVWFEGRMPREGVGVLFAFSVELGAAPPRQGRRARSLVCYERETMSEQQFPRSERTIFPRDHTRPLKGDSLAEAKQREAERQKVDPHYITADEARGLPPEAQDQPHIRERIEYSRRDWPENKAVATVALGPLDGGAGETIVTREVDSASIFEGGQMPADQGESE